MKNSLDLSKEEIKKTGYALVDEIAEFFDHISQKSVAPSGDLSAVRAMLRHKDFPEKGASADGIVAEASELLLNHSLLSGHPRYLGYIVPSSAPIGAFAEMLAASVNPNLGAHILSPVATKLEQQTIQWISGFIGLQDWEGGLMVSGGNMANITAFIAGLNEKTGTEGRNKGFQHQQQIRVYCPESSHTWIEKSAMICGLGTEAIRWIPVDENNQMRVDLLQASIEQDLSENLLPALVSAVAGDVSTGAIDPLKETAAICKQYGLWYHIDGAYGAVAASIPELKNAFEGLQDADSIALDPHKWMYAPIDAGCVLVKKSAHLHQSFSTNPDYYNFMSHGQEQELNYFEYGLENSRPFRALKVWMIMKQLGAEGLRQLIRRDIELSQYMYQRIKDYSDLEVVSNHLSIVVFRYRPSYNNEIGNNELNQINMDLVSAIQQGGEVFLSNAIIQGKYCLRACFMNFRTSENDVDEILELVVRVGNHICNRDNH